MAVPPALPACLTIATVLAIGRLRSKSVFVTAPDSITMAGQLDVICFDKTGVCCVCNVVSGVSCVCCLFVVGSLCGRTFACFTGNGHTHFFGVVATVMLLRTLSAIEQFFSECCFPLPTPCLLLPCLLHNQVLATRTTITS